MKKVRKNMFYVLLLMFSLLVMLAVAVPSAQAYYVLVWEGSASASGEEIVSPVLKYGGRFLIVANETWLYNIDDNLAADAQYYTTDWSSTWVWGDNFTAPPPMSGHSFLQINGQDVNWGPFSQGYDHLGHSYTINYIGEGKALTFRIFDWVDGNYTNNVCHLHVLIYKNVVVGGYVADISPWEANGYFVIGALTLALIIAVPLIKFSKRVQHKVG